MRGAIGIALVATLSTRIWAARDTAVVMLLDDNAHSFADASTALEDLGLPPPVASR